MKNIEEIQSLLRAKGDEYKSLEAPTEMEERLSKTLENKRSYTAKRRYSWLAKTAVILLTTLIISYNINTLAFYGKKFMGYDTIMSKTLRQLNELGMGQVIGESYTFTDGSKVTLDGVMIDNNQLLAFYTIKHSGGKVDSIQAGNYIKGLFGRHNMKHGQGELNEEGTEVKWVTSYDAPMIFERTLTLKFIYRDNDIHEEGAISFKIDREKAMKYTLKKRLDISLKHKHTKVHLDSISASPTNTIINGSLQGTLGLIKDQLSGERMRPKKVKLKLFANGVELAEIAGSMTTDINGISFSKEYDPLPIDINTLQIYVDSITVDEDVKGRFTLDKTAKKQEIELLSQRIEINEVYESDKGAHITITTLEDTLLSRVYLMVDGNKTPLTNTTNQQLIKSPEGTIYHKRTLNFPISGDTYELIVEAISFSEDYDKKIDIPID